MTFPERHLLIVTTRASALREIMMIRIARLFLVVCALAACGKSHDDNDSTFTATKLIGATGGTIELASGSRVVIPAGALSDPTQITVTELDRERVEAMPSSLELAGTPIAFEPHGTRFARAVTIEVPFEGSATNVRAIRLDDEQDTSWQPVLGTTSSNGKLSFQSMTFSVIAAARTELDSGIGGSGGMGGFGGVTDDDAGAASGNGGDGGNVGPDPCAVGNIPAGAQCVTEAEGWFAIKTVRDVWWQGVPTRDPGRGDIETYALVKIDNVCADGSNGGGTLKVCGMTLPPMTNNGSCDAFQVELPNELWDSPSMPRFYTTTNFRAFNPGDLLSLTAASGLLGIDLIDGSSTTHDTWPTPIMTTTINCEAGTGLNCFPDHDNDGRPGITARVRTDGATYTGPYGDGLCTTGVAYRYRGAPASVDLGFGVGIRVQEIALGMRTVLQGGGQVGSDCSSGAGNVDAATVESRAWDCSIDPSTLPQGEVARSGCSPAEAQFVDDNLPTYLALQAGQVPGDTMAPLGWTFAGREIDKSPSVGPRSAFVRLGDASDVEPTCAQVRSATYPSL